MDILNKKSNNSFSKPEMEMVEQEKDEYKLISQYLRTKGLMLFSYNSIKEEIHLIKIEKKKDAIITFEEGNIGTGEMVDEECVVDSRNIHFECLNKKSAEKRVEKYKEGKIKELCNLRLPSKDGLKLW